MNIPELSINPLAHRLERLFESINFKVMLGLLYECHAEPSVQDGMLLHDSHALSRAYLLRALCQVPVPHYSPA